MGVIDQRALHLVGGDGGGRAEAETFIKRLIAVGQIGRLRALAADPANAELRAVLLQLLPEAELQTEAGR
jgi:hypothetical protein